MKIINKIIILISEVRTKARYSVVLNSIKHVGVNVRLDDDIYFNMPQNLIIKDNVFIGKGVFLNAYDMITIGNDCAIAADCKLITANHKFDDLSIPINNQGHNFSPIHLEEDVWLGYNVTILPGVYLGKGCIVAAGAVVTKSFDAYSIIGGVPAKLIQNRKKME